MISLKNDLCKNGLLIAMFLVRFECTFALPLCPRVVRRVMGAGLVLAVTRGLYNAWPQTRASCKQFAQESCTTREKDELKAILTRYQYDYIADRMTGKSFSTPPTFLRKQQLEVVLPGWSGGGFMFVGQKGELFSEQAQEAVNNKQCITCKNIPLILDERARYTGEVLLAGTTDQQHCREFYRQYLKDAATMAARGQLSPKDPISVTPVLRITDAGIESVGELIDIAQVRQPGEPPLFGMDLGAATYYALQKNRLSNGCYVPIGAVVLDGFRYDPDSLEKALHAVALHELLSNAPQTGQ